MKCRKILAIATALAVLAISSVTGFAAAATATSITTYNLEASAKADVVTTVTGLTASQVTYLVKDTNADATESNIIYIDQQKVVDSSATFTYKIDKKWITSSNLDTYVSFGNDGDDTITGGALTFTAIADSDVDGNNYSIDYDFAVVGTEDEITATITADSGYELVSVNGTEVTGSTYVLSDLTTSNYTDITVVVKSTISTPVLDQTFAPVVETEIENSITHILKKTNTVATSYVGVVYDGTFYPAQSDGTENEILAVKLVFGEDDEVSSTDVVPVTVDASGNIYNADGSAYGQDIELQ